MKASELIRLSDSESSVRCEAPGDREFPGVSRDSRTVRPGEIFALLSGMGGDGMRYLREAEGKGAGAILTDDPALVTSLPRILTDRVRAAYARFCAAFAGNPQRTVRLFAVTGTNGKTSTSFLAESILSASGRSTALIGTTGARCGGSVFPFPDEKSGVSQMTTPDPEILYPLLARLAETGVTDVVMEASSHSLALDKLDPLRFRCGIYTNFSPEHLDFHGTMEEYRRAKCKLAPLCGTVLYNGDDPTWRETFSGMPGARSFGLGEAYYRAKDPAVRPLGGVHYLLSSPDAIFTVASPLPGVFTVCNSLAAAALGLTEGIHPLIIAETVRSISTIPGRMERVPLDRTKSDFAVYLDFAHTEAALRSLLSSLSPVREAGQRVISLFGCGGDRDRSKRAPMGRAACELSDYVYITEDNSRTEDPERIFRDILKGTQGYENYRVIPDRRSAIRQAILDAREGDVIILAGKGHETYEIDAAGRRPFSEREIVLSAAKEKYEGKKRSKNEH